MINPVEKISITASKKYQNQLICAIQDCGVMEITEWEDNAQISRDITDIEYSRAQVKFALNFLSENSEKEKFSIQSLLPAPIELTQKKIKEKMAKLDHIKIIDKVEKLEKKTNELHSRKLNLKDKIQLLEDWKNLNFNPNANLSSSVIKLFKIEKTKLSDLVFELSKTTKLFALEELACKNNKCQIAIFYAKKLENKIDAILQKHDAKMITLAIKKDIKAEVKQAKENLKSTQQEQAQTKKTITKLSKQQKTLKIAFDYLNWTRDSIITKSKARFSEHTFSIQGWIATEDLTKVKKSLSNITNEYNIENIEPNKDEKNPIVLKNKKFITPFETVTAIYGAPQSTDMDPTPYMTPFFIVFFGLCLTDAGYGFLLALLSYLLLTKVKLTEQQKKLPRVLMYGGIVTFFAGALFGSWFGIDLNILPPQYRYWFKFVQIMDPINNPMPTLILSAVLGIIQTLSAFIFTLINKIKSDKRKDALLDETPWLIFFALFGLLIASKYVTALAPFATTIKYGLYASIILLIGTQGRAHKNIFMKIGGGVLSLYNIVGYISDIISYSRIFALGLVTGIIAMVINIIAMLFKDMIPYVGWIVAIVILIGGHIFNLAINALSAFIHSGRLQFVEFFSKMIEGGGNWLQPLKKESQFVQIIDEKK